MTVSGRAVRCAAALGAAFTRHVGGNDEKSANGSRDTLVVCFHLNLTSSDSGLSCPKPGNVPRGEWNCYKPQNSETNVFGEIETQSGIY